MNTVEESISRWKDNGLPRKGWTLIDVVDNEETLLSCHWCGTSIRYSHHIFHEEIKMHSVAGCICAGHLTNDYETSHKKETLLKNIASMSKRWVGSKRWNVTVNGNYFRRDQIEYILIFRKDRGWKIKIGHMWGEKVYDTVREAKIASLRWLNEISTKSY